MKYEKNTKPYILKHLDSIKLSRFQNKATSIINYGPFIDNMFALENFAYVCHRQPINVVNP